MVVGATSCSCNEIVGNTTAVPPAAVTPRRTDSVRSRSPMLHGVSPLQLEQMPMTGRRRTSSRLNPPAQEGPLRPPGDGVAKRLTTDRRRPAGDVGTAGHGPSNSRALTTQSPVHGGQATGLPGIKGGFCDSVFRVSARSPRTPIIGVSRSGRSPTGQVPAGDLVGVIRQVAVDWLVANRTSAFRRLPGNKHRRFRAEDVLSLAEEGDPRQHGTGTIGGAFGRDLT